MAKIGRPSLYSEEIVETILAKLGDGTPLAEICRADEEMPAPCTIRAWMAGDVEGIDAAKLSSDIARAREIGFDAIATRARATARKKGPDDGGDSTDDVQRDKLIIETDLKLLAKWDPKRYGDLLKLSGADGQGPVPTLQITAEMTPAQAAEAYSKLMG